LLEVYDFSGVVCISVVIVSGISIAYIFSVLVIVFRIVPGIA